MAKNPRDIILEPVVSEKSYDLIQEANTYTFIVDKRSNKTEIKQAVQQIFDVRVTSVNTMNRKGKTKRTGWTFGKRPDTKRALVTLGVGNSIDIFEVS
jgi:large subunit ribosomal protein L23